MTAIMEDINEQLFVPTAIADITGASYTFVHHQHNTCAALPSLSDNCEEFLKWMRCNAFGS